MSAFKVKSLWTAFVTAFFAVLASLGLMSTTAAAAQPRSRSTQVRPRQPRPLLRCDGPFRVTGRCHPR